MSVLLELNVRIHLILVVTIAIVLGPIFILPFVYASDRDRRFMQVQYDQSSKASAIAALIFIMTMILVVWRGSWPNELGNLAAIYFIPVAGFGLGLLSVAEGGSYACTLYNILRTGDTEAGAVPERLCVVTGRASDGDSQSAPITDRPAFAWEWEFYSHSRFGPGSWGWSGVDAGTDSVPFTIDDGSGPIQVDPSNAELDLSEEKTVECAPDSPPDGAAAVIDLDVGGKQFRFVERILPPGDQVTAIGEPSDGSLNPDLLIVGDRGAVLRRYGYRVFKYGISGGAVSMVSLLITAAGFGAL